MAKKNLFKCQACENAHVFHYNCSFLPKFIFSLEAILMQLGEEGGFDDQVVSFYTPRTSVSFFQLYLRTNILYALSTGSDSTLGQFQHTSLSMKKPHSIRKPTR
jgi:hypothetical protein